jgi:hypothetical protein
MTLKGKNSQKFLLVLIGSAPTMIREIVVFRRMAF